MIITVVVVSGDKDDDANKPNDIDVGDDDGNNVNRNFGVGE